MDAEQIKALIEALKNQDGDAALAIAEAMLVSAASGEAASAAESDPLAASAEPTPPSPEEEALEATLTLLTGVGGPAERTAFLKKLIDDRAKHAERVATLELSSRFELVSELVKLGVEFPSTAFVGDPSDRKLVARLANEPIPELRARVAVLKQAKGAPPAPPTRGTETVTLSAFDAAAAKKAGMTPEQFTAAKKKAVRRI
jgi:hypothetical protein